MMLFNKLLDCSIVNDRVQELIKEDRIDDARLELVALINSWEGKRS